MNLSKVIDEVARLEHFHTLGCPGCGELVRHHVLQIHVTCPKCLAEQKVRAFGGIGTEIQDVIDAVLEWAGEGEGFEAVMMRRKQIQEHLSALRQPAS